MAGINPTFAHFVQKRIDKKQVKKKLNRNITAKPQVMRMEGLTNSKLLFFLQGQIDIVRAA